MSEISPIDEAEVARLREQIAELRKLVSAYDRTLPRFRWHPVMEKKRQDTATTYVWCTKVEFFGGPADGQTGYQCLTLPETIVAEAVSINGRTVKPKYRRCPADAGDIIAFKSEDIVGILSRDEIHQAFAGKRATRYSIVPRGRSS